MYVLAARWTIATSIQMYCKQSYGRNGTEATRCHSAVNNQIYYTGRVQYCVNSIPFSVSSKIYTVLFWTVR